MLHSSGASGCNASQLGAETEAHEIDEDLVEEMGLGNVRSINRKHEEPAVFKQQHQLLRNGPPKRSDVSVLPLLSRDLSELP